MEFLSRLFDTSDFPPRWQCGQWSVGHGWLHVLSDLGVWSAYVAIPLVLGFFPLRRKDLPFRGIFLLFGAFILACGTTHLMEALIFWWPAYRLAGAIKLFTAIVSWATVVALIPIVPRVLAMRSPEELEREIVGRKAAEQALQRANDDLEQRIDERTRELRLERERFRTTLSSIGDAVIATDTVGRVTFLNGVARGLTGWGDEAVGRPLTDVFAITDERTGAPVESPVVKVLREGQIVGLANHTALRSRDGTLRPIDDSGAPIRGEDGTIAGVVLVFRDVTERRQAEDLLRASEENFRTLADNIPQLAWMTRPDGHIFWYNRRWYEYTGTRFEQMEGWGWQSVHDPADLPRVLEKFRAHLASGEPWEDTFALRRRDGQMRWHLSRAHPVRDGDGRIVRWFGTNTDITDRLEIEEALREADRRKDDFLAVLAHELRNPLAPLSNGLAVMRHAAGDSQAVEQARGMMERQLGHMVHLVDDLLEVNRITRGLVELRRQRVDLGAVVRSAVETSRPAVDASRHTLDVALPELPVYVDADPTRLAQAFANLLHNSAKYTPPGGRIAITARGAGVTAELSVRDTGIGIAADTLPRVFDMFTQADRSLEKTQGGLGIGLTIAKRLVELHGGTITAASEGLGRGSEFTVRLPAAAAPAASSPGPHAEAPRPVVRRKVLIADDNHDAAASLAMLLRTMGHETRTAADGEAAAAAAEAFRPDVILMDIGMPRLNGYDACRRIRATDWGRDVTIVALTGWGQADDRRRSEEAGFDRHVVKPVEPGVLEGLLAEVPRSRSVGSEGPALSS